jgi:hypothetical protein
VRDVNVKAFKMGLRRKGRSHYESNRRYILGNPYFDSLTDAEAAYIAGVFDGEGSLCGRRQYWYLEITNTNKNLVAWLLQKLPEGTVHWQDRGEYKPCASFRVNGNFRVRCLLLRMMPYLTVKRPKGLEVIADIEAWESDVFILQRELQGCAG